MSFEERRGGAVHEQVPPHPALARLQPLLLLGFEVGPAVVRHVDVADLVADPAKLSMILENSCATDRPMCCPFPLPNWTLTKRKY